MEAGHLLPLRELHPVPDHPEHPAPHDEVSRRPNVFCGRPWLLQPPLHPPLHDRVCTQTLLFRSQGKPKHNFW